MPVTIFLSHSTRDDATVAALRTALESHSVSVWADSQRLSAVEARQQALDAYLAYRCTGDVSQSPLAKQYALVAQALTIHQPNDTALTLATLAQRPALPDFAKPVIAALQASSPAPATPPWLTTRT